MKSIKEAKQTVTNYSRRRFLIGSVGTSLLMAFAPLSYASVSTREIAEGVGSDRFSPTVWFEIANNGQINVNIPRAEMGQHVGTALARIVADELGANWDDVSITHVDTDPKWGYMVTGGSWSVHQSFAPFSQAGAAGRMVLLEAGAKLLKVKPGDCRVENSQVICSGKAISFADIVSKEKLEKTYTPEELAALPIKPAKQRNLIGKETHALDIPAKINGSATYGLDVEFDGMVYARPVLPPTTYGSKVNKVDDSDAKKIDGYLGYEILDDPSELIQGWVVVLAKDYVSAIKAADRLKVDVTAGDTADVSESDILAHGQKLVNDPKQGAWFVNEGNVDNAKSDSKNTLESVYRTHTVLHLALEPLNATVYQEDGVWHVHGGNQWQSLTLPAIAKALQVSEDKVVIHTYYLGGGFGRRLFGDYMIPAALTAKQTGKTVKFIFTREDDSKFDQPRSASVSRFQSYFDKDNNFMGMTHGFCAGWPTMAMAPAFMPEGANDTGKLDPFSAAGADHWYSMANHRALAINNDLAQKTFKPGWLRSVGQGWIVWGLESFIDETAEQAGMNPIDFRLSLLDGKGKQAGTCPNSTGGAKRLHHVLSRLKDKLAESDKPGENEGVGVSVSSGQERNMPAWLAVAAHVKVDKSSGKVEVKKLTLVMDCGTVVHPDGALAQLEGGALWGLSMALHEGTEFKNGQVKDLNLNTYTPLRHDQVPELDIEFIDSTEVPVGLGEPGVIGIAPAIGNAIYQAVGVRVKDLPIRPEHIKKLLS
ncbi:xanthine dehydrogenase family protein molybdopterin-binding subunit [Thalassotalea mangrovi]|uniref:Xanthine dehydrogenase family protein molybdopterin-binding subunit n=1 Tax=Thalassotalea mangrovi TaxID=2572245 RepID=A0A4U1B1G0_9GAMM|nr:molybdopterin cofactor-binding domain-containing protein [Thalassotalea mangrovi]TKB43253.1 xanthine dehydrogenase family protein molybdopterin-binding subunit [Thalassotalea mangrovi]